jgi:hypothetical protein
MGSVVGSIVGSVASSVIGGAISSKASKQAANVQAQTAADQMALQKQIFDIQNEQQAPYRSAGYNSLNLIGSLLPGQYTQYDAQGNPIGTATGSGYLTRQFTNEDLNTNLAPNYAWQLGQGTEMVRNLANSSGGLISGNTLKSLEDYTQNFAGNAYQNAFNNYQSQRGDIYNTLASIAGIGQKSVSQSNANAGNYGTNVANLATGGAAAQAGGIVGSANAWSGAANNIGNMFTLGNILNTPTAGGGGYFAGSPAYSPGYSSLANAQYPNFSVA